MAPGGLTAAAGEADAAANGTQGGADQAEDAAPIPQRETESNPGEQAGGEERDEAEGGTGGGTEPGQQQREQARGEQGAGGSAEAGEREGAGARDIGGGEGDGEGQHGGEECDEAQRDITEAAMGGDAPGPGKQGEAGQNGGKTRGLEQQIGDDRPRRTGEIMDRAGACGIERGIRGMVAGEGDEQREADGAEQKADGFREAAEKGGADGGRDEGPRAA